MLEFCFGYHSDVIFVVLITGTGYVFVGIRSVVSVISIASGLILIRMLKFYNPQLTPQDVNLRPMT